MSDLRELIIAVMAPDAELFELEDDGPRGRGRRGRRLSLAEAATGAVSVLCTRSNLSLVPLDLDECEYPGIVSRAVTSVRRAGVASERIVRQTSGRISPDGVPNEHWWIRCERPSEAEDLGAVLGGELGSAVRWGKGMRPPLTPHRHGGHVGLLDPVTVAEAAARLRSHTSVMRCPDPWPFLARIANDTAPFRTHDGSPDRSAHTLSFAAKMKGRGFAFTTFERYCTSRAYAVSAKYFAVLAEAGQSAADGMLRRTWKKAYDVSGIDSVRESIRAIYSALPVASWDGRSRASTINVVNACFDIAEFLGSLTFDIDQRTLTLTSGVASRDTVARALNRACTDYGVLECVSVGQGNVASTYRIRPPSDVDWAIQHTAPLASNLYGLSSVSHGNWYGREYVSHELFSRYRPSGCTDDERYAPHAKCGGFGPQAAWIYGFLDDEPRTVAEIVESIPALDLRGARKALRRLGRYALAKRHPGRTPRWTRVEATQLRLQILADIRHVAGRHDTSRAKIATERELQAQWISGGRPTIDQAIANHGLTQVNTPSGRPLIGNPAGRSANADRTELSAV